MSLNTPVPDDHDQDDAASLAETRFLCAIPGMARRLTEAAQAPDEDFVDISQVEW